MKDDTSCLKGLSDLILEKSQEQSMFLASTRKNIYAYRKNYIFSLLESLKSSYPSVYITLGEDNFSYFSYQYIKKHPSKAPNIDLYGEGFPKYLKNTPELKEDRIISYLAQIDWFLFSEDTNMSILLPHGLLKVWENIILEKDEEDFIIDESSKEKIELSMNTNGDYFLFIKKRET